MVVFKPHQNKPLLPQASEQMCDLSLLKKREAVKPSEVHFVLLTDN